MYSPPEAIWCQQKSSRTTVPLVIYSSTVNNPENSGLQQMCTLPHSSTIPCTSGHPRVYICMIIRVKIWSLLWYGPISLVREDIVWDIFRKICCFWPVIISWWCMKWRIAAYINIMISPRGECMRMKGELSWFKRGQHWCSTKFLLSRITLPPNSLFPGTKLKNTRKIMKITPNKKSKIMKITPNKKSKNRLQKWTKYVGNHASGADKINVLNAQ